MDFVTEKEVQHRRTMQRYVAEACKGTEMQQRQKEVLRAMPINELCLEKLNLTHKMGSGSYGVVLKGTWRDKDVAVKILNPQGIPRKNQFKHCQEAEVLREAVGIPNVLQLFGTFFDRNLFLVTELAKGSLSSAMPIPISACKRFAVQLMEALAWLEAKRLVHCDIKTCNILITSTNDACLADFGECTTMAANQEFIQKDRLVGTLSRAHCSCNERMRYEFRSDVASLGIALFEGISGIFLMQTNVRSFEDPEKEAKFYAQCFMEGRIKEKLGKKKLIEERIDGAFVRERLADRISKNVQDDEFRSVILEFINPGGNICDISLASETVKTDWFLLQKELYLNAERSDEIIEFKRPPAELKDLKLYKAPEIGDATLLALNYYYDRFAVPPPIESPRDQPEVIDIRSLSNDKSKKKKTKPVIKYKCKICGKEFDHQPNLSRHGNLHKDRRPEKLYRCQVCQKTFGRSDHLKNHLKTHLKPIACTKCDFQCKYKKELKDHCRKHK